MGGKREFSRDKSEEKWQGEGGGGLKGSKCLWSLDVRWNGELLRSCSAVLGPGVRTSDDVVLARRSELKWRRVTLS